MKGGIIALLLAMHHCADSAFLVPDVLNDELLEEEANERKYPEEDEWLSRRDNSLWNDEDYRLWNDEDGKEESDGDDSDSNVNINRNINGVSSSYSSSVSSSGGHSRTVIDGIDSSSLPPNYHKVKTVTKMISGHPVLVNVTIDKKTDPVTGQVSFSVSESSGSSSSAAFCNAAKPCKMGSFCLTSLAGSYCTKCSAIREPCVENAQCCGIGTKGSLCVNGSCQKGYTKGDEGTLCKKTRDCKKGMCCARAFMKKNGICKPLAKKGQKCAASRSGMNSMLHPWTCPCVKGLKCSSGSQTESFFHGSMNTLLGGNTCRTKKRRRSRGGKRWFWGDGSKDDEYVQNENEEYPME